MHSIVSARSRAIPNEWPSSVVHPTEIRNSISPSSAVELNMTSALANYATETSACDRYRATLMTENLHFIESVHHSSPNSAPDSREVNSPSIARGGPSDLNDRADCPLGHLGQGLRPRALGVVAVAHFHALSCLMYLSLPVQDCFFSHPASYALLPNLYRRTLPSNKTAYPTLRGENGLVSKASFTRAVGRGGGGAEKRFDRAISSVTRLIEGGIGGVGFEETRGGLDGRRSIKYSAEESPQIKYYVKAERLLSNFSLSEAAPLSVEYLHTLALNAFQAFNDVVEWKEKREKASVFVVFMVATEVSTAPHRTGADELSRDHCTALLRCGADHVATYHRKQNVRKLPNFVFMLVPSTVGLGKRESKMVAPPDEHGEVSHRRGWSIGLHAGRHLHRVRHRLFQPEVIFGRILTFHARSPGRSQSKRQPLQDSRHQQRLLAPYLRSRSPLNRDSNLDLPVIGSPIYCERDALYDTPTKQDEASSVLSSMDLNVDPCDNFYDFACGQFIKKTTIPDEKSSVNRFTLISDELQMQLRQIVDEPVKADDLKPFRLAKDLFRSCINKSSIEERGLGPFRELLKELGGWPVLEGDAWKEADFTWLNTVYKFRKAGYSVDYFMDFSPNLRASDSYVTTYDRCMYVCMFVCSAGPRSTGSESRVPHQRSKREAYQGLPPIGADQTRVEREMREALDFEIKLANISLPSEMRRNISLLYNPTTVEGLQKDYPSIPWLEYINNILPKDIQVRNDELIIVAVPSYLRALEGILSNTPKSSTPPPVFWLLLFSLLHAAQLPLLPPVCCYPLSSTQLNSPSCLLSVVLSPPSEYTPSLHPDLV
uniref:Peptidase M13 N-terminal domain-containing protein n=1 Tax=Timema tahoe TaxID=61484 RepID=A0A7R9FF45_9NEOP|nr:unnamed protein product [Timema tahoe]